MNEIDEGIAQTSNQGQAAILGTVGDWEREAGGAVCLLVSEEGESTPLFEDSQHPCVFAYM